MRREPPPSISDPEAECSRDLIKNKVRRSERRCFRRCQAGAQQAAIVVRRLVIRWGFMALACSICLPTHAIGGELVLYGAGSLREVMTQIAADYQATHGLQVRTDFGPSGLMRERIERGEKVDVFASADIGHPLRLQQDGRATVVAMFTRNTLCAVALPRVGLTTANLLDRLLDPGVKLGTSTPKADPAGDYTWAMFRWKAPTEAAEWLAAIGTTAPFRPARSSASTPTGR